MTTPQQHHAIEFRVVVVRSDGVVFLPGGVCARICAGAPGQALPFPVVGVFQDGNDTPIVFMDNGPTPLLAATVDGGRGFPNIVLAGLTPGVSVAYMVAKDMDSARLIAAGGQLATDSAGRVVVVTPSGTVLSVLSGAPTLATFQAEFLFPAVGTPLTVFAAILPTSKPVRIRKLDLLWPGKQTTGARESFQYGHCTGLVGSGALFPLRLDLADAATAGVFSAVTGVIAVTPAEGVAGFFCPAADGAFQPYTVKDFDDVMNAKPLIIAVGDQFEMRNGNATAAGYDGNALVRVTWTEGTP